MNKIDILNVKDRKPKGRRRGMLPSYWVNLDELAQVFLDLVNRKTYENYGKQKIDGIILNVQNNIKEQSVEWSNDEDIVVLTGIEFSPNDCRNIGYLNSFDMYIDDELYFEDIYIKEVEEYKHFNIRKPLKKNSKVKFVFKNRDNMLKQLMLHIHYLGDIKVKKFIILHKDIDTKETLQRNELFVVQPFKEQIVCPIEIQGYIKVSEDCIAINDETDEEIVFYYEKEELPILHQYDILCKLYWESSIDLDLHCLINNEEEVYYSNKELIIDDNNGCWLDYDYTKWRDEPEIITILGFKDKKALLKINHFSGNLSLNENIKLQIFKKEYNKKDILLKEISLNGSLLEHKNPKNICEINLKTQEIKQLI